MDVAWLYGLSRGTIYGVVRGTVCSSTVRGAALGHGVRVCHIWILTLNASCVLLTRDWFLNNNKKDTSRKHRKRRSHFWTLLKGENQQTENQSVLTYTTDSQYHGTPFHAPWYVLSAECKLDVLKLISADEMVGDRRDLATLAGASD